eukprot:jgi/Chrzof1/2222/Cz11g07080.t1
MWWEYMRSVNVSSWELQLSAPLRLVNHRDDAITAVEDLMRRFSEHPSSQFKVMPESRWTAVFQETMFMLNSRDGQPLHPQPGHGGEQPFPWKGVGDIRLRSYRTMTPAHHAKKHSHQPGTADLTFKMKTIGPDVYVGDLVDMPSKAHGAKLRVKYEHDVHCDHDHTTLSPMYHPVPGNMNISTLTHVRCYFPNLAEVMSLDEHEQLPFMHQFFLAKTVWTVRYSGVIGELDLVIKYANFEDAAAGVHAIDDGELSLRIRRHVAAVDDRKVLEGMDTLAVACQAFRDAGALTC